MNMLMCIYCRVNLPKLYLITTMAHAAAKKIIRVAMADDDPEYHSALEILQQLHAAPGEFAMLDVLESSELIKIIDKQQFMTNIIPVETSGRWIYVISMDPQAKYRDAEFLARMLPKILSSAAVDATNTPANLCRVLYTYGDHIMVMNMTKIYPRHIEELDTISARLNAAGCPAVELSILPISFNPAKDAKKYSVVVKFTSAEQKIISDVANIIMSMSQEISRVLFEITI